ncbi:hypothetical protein LEP1GSC125_2874 [Leptospira mayottensis 200901122]|uniref:Uncharacterized protein n=2 Tax=Leptospira mayottensis TaxID=1137606 RepID=A0AA87MQ07_9LEPT|nr:hypothetical protein DQM28_03380 [Leptospira mayottensis]EKS00284.1 hypothetical protein LEP1GSC125_2874 [Leptospira mayottensis 200901122]
MRCSISVGVFPAFLKFCKSPYSILESFRCYEENKFLIYSMKVDFQFVAKSRMGFGCSTSLSEEYNCKKGVLRDWEIIDMTFSTYQ